MLNIYLITNGDESTIAVVLAINSKQAIEILKTRFDKESSFTEYDPESDGDFDLWDNNQFYDKFPKKETTVELIEKKSCIVTYISSDMYH